MTATPRPTGSAAAFGPGTDVPNYLSHRQILVVLGGLMTGMLLAALDQSIVSVALPRIVSDLGGLDKLSWVVTAYLLTSTASTPLWGKISDLYGRRKIFQIAIVVFLVGSMLSGLAQDMPELIGSRALQGVGGGGLMSLALAIIGDVIPPRERGRYQGYFGAVFGVSSVAGPLLGGYFTDGPGWRWIFYINVPIGIAALVVTSFALKIKTIRHEHKVDYNGAALIVASVSCILLYLSWRGTQYGWTDPYALVLLIGGLALAGLFVLVESRASEPIIPLRLFRNSIFTVGNIFGFLAGFAMFGAIIYLPIYLQVARGLTPMESGLAMLPAVVGIFASSIGSGQLMTRTGRYKIYPIIGAVVMAVGMALLGTLHADSSILTIGVFEFLVGFGLGFTMQTITTAVQNSIHIRDMGSATSSTMFFRQMGGAFGTAVFGAFLVTRLKHYVAQALTPAQLAHVPTDAIQNVQVIHQLPQELQTSIVSSYVHALDNVFLLGVPFCVLAIVVAFTLKEIPLRTKQHGVADAAEQPPAGDPDALTPDRVPT